VTVLTRDQKRLRVGSEPSGQKMNDSPCSSSEQRQRAAIAGPMIYILKGKVSWLRLMAIIWTASSDAARQACGEAAACWGNAQAVTFYRPISKSRSGGMRWKLKVMGGVGRRRRAREERRPRRHARRLAETRGAGGPSGMARDRCLGGLQRSSGLSLRRRRVKRYGQGPG
jgi:hypothetical protein